MSLLVKLHPHLFKTDSPATIKKRVKNVYYDNTREMWFVQIKVGDHNRYFGHYLTHAAAVEAKDKALKKIEYEKGVLTAAQRAAMGENIYARPRK